MKEFNKQYKDMRNCISASKSVTKRHGFALAEDVYNCKGTDIMWYLSKYQGGLSDFTVATFETPSISFETSDVVSDEVLKQVKVNSSASAELALEVEINMDYTSRLLQAIMDIIRTSSTQEDRLKTLTAYANGGFWFMEEIIMDEGQPTEYTQRNVYPQVVITEMNIPFSGVLEEDSTYKISMTVINVPIFEEEGLKPEGWAEPQILDNIVLQDLTLSGTDYSLNITDVDGFLSVDENNFASLIVSNYLIDDITGEVEFIDMSEYKSTVEAPDYQFTFPATEPVTGKQRYMTVSSKIGNSWHMYLNDYTEDELPVAVKETPTI